MTTGRTQRNGTNERSPRTLMRAPERLFMFLAAMADPAIARRVRDYGWSKERCEEGRSFLRELTAYPPDESMVDAAQDDAFPIAARACGELQAGAILRARGMLKVACPAQYAFLFHDFAPSRGLAAIADMATLLRRIEVLREGTGREAFREDDRVALGLMAEMGLGEKELAAIARTIDSEVPVGDGGGTTNPPTTPADRQAARVQLLSAIHDFLAKWQLVARSVITRRDHLIRLGIAVRRNAVSRPVATMM
jgi:hypothetical protein